MEPQGIIHTVNGPIADPERPARRIKVQGGSYTTSDPDEIKFLKTHPEFNQAGPDGFSIMRKMSVEEELAAVAARHNTTPEELLERARG